MNRVLHRIIDIIFASIILSIYTLMLFGLITAIYDTAQIFYDKTVGLGLLHLGKTMIITSNPNNIVESARNTASKLNTLIACKVKEPIIRIDKSRCYYSSTKIIISLNDLTQNSFKSLYSHNIPIRAKITFFVITTYNNILTLVSVDEGEAR